MAPKRKFNGYRDIRGGRYGHARDSKRQRCYDWENSHLRGKSATGAQANWRVSTDGDGEPFKDRNAAKGFARLCVKVGLKRLETHLAERLGEGRAKAITKAARETFRAHFTKDKRNACCGGINGVYFAEWGWTKTIIAHEVAHFIDHQESAALKHVRAGHGEHWLGWFVFLLEDVCKFNRDYLLTTLSTARLSIIPK